MTKTSPNIGSTWKYGWNIPQNRFYLPAALAVPPSQFLVHSQFVFLFQVWSFCLSLSGLEIFKGIHPELDVRNSYIVNFTQLHLSTYSSVLDSLGANRWHRPSWTYFQHVHISSGDPLPIKKLITMRIKRGIQLYINGDLGVKGSSAANIFWTSGASWVKPILSGQELWWIPFGDICACYVFSYYFFYVYKTW